MSLKDAKKNFVVDVATDLFLARPIDEVKIKDVATASGVGEATIYRYFNNKETLLSAVIMKLEERTREEYFDFSKGKNGFEKLTIFYNSFLKVYRNKPEFFRFIHEFDSHMVIADKQLLAEYENSIDCYKQAFFSFYKEGLEDGSVREIPNLETIYYATTHAIMELCKKLSLAKVLLRQDENGEKAKEISALIDIILTTFPPCAPSASKIEKDNTEEGR